MKKDVKIRVHFKPGKSKRTCKPLSLLGDLIESERMELAVQSIMAENLYHIHEKSQNRSVALMSGLIQNRCDKGWVWIKGVIGKGPMKGQTHYWLESDGWAVESTDIPGSVLTDPHGVLVMDAGMYRKEMKLKAVTTRKAKQVTQWLLKQKKKRDAAMQDKPAPARPTAPRPVTPPTPPVAPEPKAAAETKCKPEAVTPPAQPVQPAPSTKAGTADESCLDTAARELAAMDPGDKTAYKDRLMEVMNTLKAEGITQTRIATVFLKEKVPTRSGRGTWNPRMVGDIFKQI
ncbi:hypothetical protein [Desulfoluna spongiiphila]|uniref:hypothetical protein n=1 Tax=Desulfoluna spongiiphila TaxID=419481 RepID=UPI001254D6ED|nr:hypothetical protein [Desulfoluna spongiiphila]VVS92998.1 consensus disorder prediction [Desulfoluna spongiiphila]